MATISNSRNSRKVGYTENQIQARATSATSTCWQVRCFNTEAHKHGDKSPSAYYFPETGYYGCRVCNLKGYANDRDRPDWTQHQVRTYSNGTRVTRDPQSNGEKKIWQSNNQTEEQPKPYNNETIHRATRRIYVVEGEKCADAVQPNLDPRSEAVITSIQGSNSPHKTDWSPVREAIGRRCEIVFLPDRDEPGEKYIQSVAQLLRLDKLNVIRLGGDREDGYDVADWLGENDWNEMPAFIIEPAIVTYPAIAKGRGYRDLFGYHEPVELHWVADGMIPRGKLTMLVGRSGIGKSTMSLYIAAELSNGRQPFTGTSLPDDLFNRGQRILIYSAEDDWNDTIAVKLMMMGANMSNIAPLLSQTDSSLSFYWHTSKDDKPDGLDFLLANLKQVPVDLLVIDPLMDIITGGNNNDPAVIREAVERKLNPILDLGCTIIGVHHERKDARKDDLLVDRAIGSQAWTGTARSVLHMQALPKRKALGTGKNPKPRASHDGKFNINQMNLETNSEDMGVITVSKSNLARVDGGYHYELPTSVPEGQQFSFIQIAINAKKIENRTPEELVQIYNPVAPEEIPESAVNRKARIDMGKETGAEKTAEKAIKDIFNEIDKIGMKELLELVMEAASVGDNSAKTAIRKLTESKHLGGNAYVRVLKHSKG